MFKWLKELEVFINGKLKKQELLVTTIQEKDKITKDEKS